MIHHQQPAISILILDDDEDDVVLTRALLAEIDGAQFHTDWIFDDESALDAILEGKHDLYLVDYRFGTGDGLELIGVAVRRGCKAPLILMTGQGDRSIDIRAMTAGATDYLNKAELTAALIDRSIRYALERKRVESELAEMRLRIADSAEAERSHLALELHDGPLQELIGARLQLGTAARQFSDDKSEEIAEVVGMIVNVIDELREICGFLRPPALAPFGLQSAIHSHAKKFATSHPEIKLILDVTDDGLTLPETVRFALFRVYQHALSNVVRHAAATEVRVEFALDDKTVRLEISDNGAGFEMPKHPVLLARQGHFGLLGAFERADSIGGRIEILSTDDSGTTLRLIAPRPRIEASSDRSIPDLGVVGSDV